MNDYNSSSINNYNFSSLSINKIFGKYSPYPMFSKYRKITKNNVTYFINSKFNNHMANFSGTFIAFHDNICAAIFFNCYIQHQYFIIKNIDIKSAYKLAKQPNFIINLDYCEITSLDKIQKILKLDFTNDPIYLKNKILNTMTIMREFQ